MWVQMVAKCLIETKKHQHQKKQAKKVDRWCEILSLPKEFPLKNQGHESDPHLMNPPFTNHLSSLVDRANFLSQCRSRATEPYPQ